MIEDETHEEDEDELLDPSLGRTKVEGEWIDLVLYTGEEERLEQ